MMNDSYKVWFRRVLLVMVTLFLASCTHVPVELSASATKTKFVEYLTAPEKSKYEGLGYLKCELGMNARTVNTNIEGCKTMLRNKGAAMGADLVVLDKEKIGSITGWGACPNCIKMSGVAYKRR